MRQKQTPQLIGRIGDRDGRRECANDLSPV
jgi:hypothetical protein